ncbi:hypothetical protein FRC0521_01847 [Corynebacterium diphtheriae]|nr:hypothetical protein FRC0521_01847 [Corynebacterium diphtheriae]
MPKERQAVCGRFLVNNQHFKRLNVKTSEIPAYSYGHHNTEDPLFVLPSSLKHIFHPHTWAIFDYFFSDYAVQTDNFALSPHIARVQPHATFVSLIAKGEQ